MNWNYLLLLIPFGWGLIGIWAMFDLRKREVRSPNMKQLLGALILFPPLLGTLLYYFFIIRPNRFPKRSDA